MDAVRVSGSRLNDPRDANEIPVPRNMNTDEEKGNPTFPILVAVIFFLVSFNFGFDYFWQKEFLGHDFEWSRDGGGRQFEAKSEL